MQNDQHWRLHGRGATEGQDESHGAPDPEADEDERDEDQLLVGHGGMVLWPVSLGEDGPVLRQGLALCRARGTGVSEAGCRATLSPLCAAHLPAGV